MAQITLGGKPTTTIGELPKIGTKAPGFKLVKNDLTTVTLDDFKGKKLILNIFPSLDTSVCAASVRHFNAEAAKLENTEVLCISKDLPFTQQRFCGAEGLNDVQTLSDFRTGKFGKDYGVEIIDGPFEGLESRAIVVVNEEGNVIYTQQVSEIGEEPNYSAALAAL